MKLGILTGLWYLAENSSVLESLSRAAALGFRYIDLHGTFHANPKHLDRQTVKSVRAALDAYCQIPRSYVLHAPFNLASANQDELDTCFGYIKEGIEAARYWGMNQLMLNAGQWAYGIDRNIAWQKAVGWLQRVCDYSARLDFFIAIETEPYVWFLINDLASARRMLADVGRENLTLLVDLGHMALARENASDLLPLSTSIIHVHISDHQVFKHTNQVVGSGFAPVVDYLNALHEMEIDQKVSRYSYDDLVASLELGALGDPIDDPDAWARKSKEFILSNAPFIEVD